MESVSVAALFATIIDCAGFWPFGKGAELPLRPFESLTVIVAATVLEGGQKKTREHLLFVKPPKRPKLLFMNEPLFIEPTSAGIFFRVEPVG